MIEETRYKESLVMDVERTPRISTEAISLGRMAYATLAPRSISWGPIWTGVAVAIGVHVILSALGAAIGFSVAGTTYVTAEGLGASAGIWMVISAMAALFVGGWVVGRFAAPRSAPHGAMHGFILWCVVTALGVALLSTTGGSMMGTGLMGYGLNQQGGYMANINGDSINSYRSSDVTENSSFTKTTTKEARRARANVAWWTLAGLLLSAGVASIGGSMAHRSRDANRFAA